MAKKISIGFNDLRLGIHKGRVLISIPAALAAKGFPIALMHNEAERLARELAALARVVTPQPLGRIQSELDRKSPA
jgi:hypothetical protein